MGALSNPGRRRAIRAAAVLAALAAGGPAAVAAVQTGAAGRTATPAAQATATPQSTVVPYRTEPPPAQATAPATAPPGTAGNAGLGLGTGKNVALTVDGGAAGVSPQLVLRGAIPGQRSTQSIRVTNAGTAPVSVTLSLVYVGESLGRHGGRLSQRLKMSATTPAGSWTGVPAAMPTLAMGRLKAGQSATARLLLHWPDGGVPASPTTGDNAFADATVRLEFSAQGTVGG